MNSMLTLMVLQCRSPLGPTDWVKTLRPGGGALGHSPCVIGRLKRKTKGSCRGGQSMRRGSWVNGRDFGVTGAIPDLARLARCASTYPIVCVGCSRDEANTHTSLDIGWRLLTRCRAIFSGRWAEHAASWDHRRQGNFRRGSAIVRDGHLS